MGTELPPAMGKTTQDTVQLTYFFPFLVSAAEL